MRIYCRAYCTLRLPLCHSAQSGGSSWQYRVVFVSTTRPPTCQTRCPRRDQSELVLAFRWVAVGLTACHCRTARHPSSVLASCDGSWYIHPAQRWFRHRGEPIKATASSHSSAWWPLLLLIHFLSRQDLTSMPLFFFTIMPRSASPSDGCPAASRIQLPELRRLLQASLRLRPFHLLPQPPWVYLHPFGLCLPRDSCECR